VRALLDQHFDPAADVGDEHVDLRTHSDEAEDLALSDRRILSKGDDLAHPAVGNLGDINRMGLIRNTNEARSFCTRYSQSCEYG